MRKFHQPCSLPASLYSNIANSSYPYAFVRVGAFVLFNKGK